MQRPTTFLVVRARAPMAASAAAESKEEWQIQCEEFKQQGMDGTAIISLHFSINVMLKKVFDFRLT